MRTTTLFPLLAFLMLSTPLSAQEEPPFGPPLPSPSDPGVQDRCGTYDDAVKNLFLWYNEVPTSFGISAKAPDSEHWMGTLFESIPALDRDKDKPPTWTLVKTTAGEQSCSRPTANGHFWIKGKSSSTKTAPGISPQVQAMIKRSGCYTAATLTDVIEAFESSSGLSFREGGMTTRRDVPTGAIAVLAGTDDRWMIVEVKPASPVGGARGCMSARGTDWVTKSAPKDYNAYMEVAQ